MPQDDSCKHMSGWTARLMIRVTFVIVLLAAVCLSAVPTVAEAACSSTDQCSSDRVCMAPKFPLGIGKECLQMPCNADSECPSARPRCQLGICQNPGFNPNTPSGAGMTQGGLGEACGPYKIGQVTKSRGCKPGLQCVNGHCQRPAQ